MRSTSGAFATIADAMFCNSIVLPAFGGETIRPRWPLPIGATMSIMRAVRSSVLPLPCSSFSRSFGNSGVRFSNSTLLRAFSGASKLICPTFSSAK
jgi:hypothetical protein